MPPNCQFDTPGIKVVSEISESIKIVGIYKDKKKYVNFIKKVNYFCINHFFYYLCNAILCIDDNENNTFSFWNTAGGDKDGAAGEEITE